MNGQIDLIEPKRPPLSPYVELGAYEAIWDRDKASFRSIAAMFNERPGSVPSDFVPESVAREYSRRVIDHFAHAGIRQFGVRIHGAGEYPASLRDAAYPVELLYYRGIWNLIEAPSVAVVGSRKPSEAGAARAQKLSRLLVEDGYTVVSGLAAGIDTIAHMTALHHGGRTIAVIGTPLSESYPASNVGLQRRLAETSLVISQVPVIRHSKQGPTINRFFFPERNATMSALTRATIIVEASDTSGTLTQARAALHQGRKLFILDSCFRNPDITWPARFEAKGAIRVTDYPEIRQHLGPATHQD